MLSSYINLYPKLWKKPLPASLCCFFLPLFRVAIASENDMLVLLWQCPSIRTVTFYPTNHETRIWNFMDRHAGCWCQPQHLSKTLSCFWTFLNHVSLNICAIASLWVMPPSIISASFPMPAAMIALQTMTGKQQFCEDPTARNSKRLPQNGKGAVRLRSSQKLTCKDTGPRACSPTVKNATRGKHRSRAKHKCLIFKFADPAVIYSPPRWLQ